MLWRQYVDYFDKHANPSSIESKLITVFAVAYERSYEVILIRLLVPVKSMRD